MEFQDYYKTLGVDRTATDAEIKAAYRKLAREFHPDRNKATDAEDQFKRVSEAYEVLRDPDKRAQYDQLGNNYQSGQNFRPPPGWETQFGGGGFGRGGFGDAGGFSDFFETLFGNSGAGFDTGGLGGQARRPEPPPTQTASIEISLEDSFHGASRRLNLATGGQSRQIDVRIPKGIRHGQRIRLTGQGGRAPNGQRGDLELEVSLAPHKTFDVDGGDILLTLPITPWEAALGAKLAIPTLGGAVTLSIPAGAKSGQTLRLRGRGLPGKTAGDQRVALQIQTPPADSDADRALYESMAEQFDFDPRAHLAPQTTSA